MPIIMLYGLVLCSCLPEIIFRRRCVWDLDLLFVQRLLLITFDSVYMQAFDINRNRIVYQAVANYFVFWDNYDLFR